ncbi:MAG: alanine racemase [Proteobacteria bacterium SG_bin9]|nr:MAG: alanine racemase [Proteobacteria bacterium SG_bin9]
MNRTTDPKALAANSTGEPHASAGGILTIDLGAIAANWKKLESKGVPAECAAVVKAGAYGCELTPVVTTLAAAGCKTFFVATLDEAESVRTAAPKAAIYVLDGFFSGTGDRFAMLNSMPVIGDMGELAEWDAYRATSGWLGGAAIHIDTGMNRLGLSVGEAEGLLPRLSTVNTGISLVMSHLACAETLGHPMNAKQVTAFREIASRFSSVPASLANSSGIFLGSNFLFDMTRPGAALYGVNPTPEADNPMQQVIDLKARIVLVRNVPKGDTVGYGATWTARRDTRLAVVTAGYADGYFRAAGGIDGTRSAEAVVGGKRCPIAGRISMDLLAIDVTDVPTPVRRNHMATLIGDGITVDELGHHFGTIGYEVLTSLGTRFARVYKEAPAATTVPVADVPAPST